MQEKTKTTKTKRTDGLASSIAICRMRGQHAFNENILVKSANEIAERIFNAPESAWMSIEERQPLPEDGEIVGRDCLGYCHLATHLVGSKEPGKTWIEEWMPVPFKEVA